MSDIWTRLGRLVRGSGRAALVSVLAVRGSAPREPGARMVVAPDSSFSGTIGGGQLEWEAIQLATGRLTAGADTVCVTDFALGPDLGQCCGGRVDIAIELFDRSDLAEIEHLAGLEASGGLVCETAFDAAKRHAMRTVVDSTDETGDTLVPADRAGLLWRERFADARTPVLLFGAGHVGRAVVLALAPLPFAVTWVDTRPDAFPSAMPRNVAAVSTRRPVDQIADAPPGGLALIMTHSHPLDLEITRAALSRADLAYVGVIGSETKRARFVRRLREAGLNEAAIARLRCPIGIEGIDGKAPAVIAASVAAELLMICQEIAQRCEFSMPERGKRERNPGRIAD
jgi:xanthine dehydrogenase accessory factor